MVVEYLYVGTEPEGGTCGVLGHCSRADDDHFRWRYSGDPTENGSLPVIGSAKKFRSNQYYRAAGDLTHGTDDRHPSYFVFDELIGQCRHFLFQQGLNVVRFQM